MWSFFCILNPNSGAGSTPVIWNIEEQFLSSEWEYVFRGFLRKRIRVGEDEDSNESIEFNPVQLVSSGEEGIRDGNCGVPFLRVSVVFM